MLHMIYTIFHNLLINLGDIVNISHVIKLFQNMIFSDSFHLSPIIGNLDMSTFCYCK